jgi:hypothetical protein
LVLRLGLRSISHLARNFGKEKRKIDRDTGAVIVRPSAARYRDLATMTFHKLSGNPKSNSRSKISFSGEEGFEDPAKVFTPDSLSGVIHDDLKTVPLNVLGWVD